MFKLLFLILSHLHFVKATCASHGLSEVDGNTLFKLSIFGARYLDRLCAWENEYIVIENGEAQHTCVGYSDVYLDSCDSSTRVCCGSGSTTGSYGYPSSHKLCLDATFYSNSVFRSIHPDCPITFPDSPVTSTVASTTSVTTTSEIASTRAPSKTPSPSLTLNPSTMQPSGLPSIAPTITASLTVSLTLVNIDGTLLSQPDNYDTFLRGLKLLHPKVEVAAILQTEQFVEYCVLIVKIQPPTEIPAESQYQLTDWLLKENSAFSIKTPPDTAQEIKIVGSSSSYMMLILVGICTTVAVCLFLYLWWNCKIKEKMQSEVSKIVVDVSDYMDVNAVFSYSPSPTDIAAAANMLDVEDFGGAYLTPEKQREGRSWTVEHILPSLPEELLTPDADDYCPSTPDKEGPGPLETSMPENHGLQKPSLSVQTDSHDLRHETQINRDTRKPPRRLVVAIKHQSSLENVELYAPEHNTSQEGDTNTLKYKI